MRNGAKTGILLTSGVVAIIGLLAACGDSGTTTGTGGGATTSSTSSGTTTTKSSTGTGTGTMSSGTMSTGTSMAGATGDACKSMTDCAGDTCAAEADSGFPGGYCSTSCTADTDCGGMDHCLGLTSGFCYKDCSTASCRAGYSCQDISQMMDGSLKICLPDCMDNTVCTAPAVCITDAMSQSKGECIAPEVCNDMKDNDLDGTVDCADSDCANDAGCKAAIGMACTNALALMPTQNGDTTNGTDVFNSTCGGNGKEVVYKYTAAKDGELDLAATATAGDLGVYVRSTCDDAATEVGCADVNFNAGDVENLNIAVKGGQTYFIYVDAYDSSGMGAFKLDSTFTVPVCGDGKVTLPEECDDSNMNNNDGCSSACKVETAFYCNNATTITAALPAMGDTTSSPAVFKPTNMGAVQDCITGSGDGNEKIYKYTPLSTGMLKINLTSAQDLGFYVRTDCGTPGSESICEDAQSGGTDETATIAVTNGTPIFIFVDGYQTAKGAFTLTLTQM